MDQNDSETPLSRPDIRRHSSPNYEDTDTLYRQEDLRRPSDSLEDTKFLRVSARAAHSASIRRRPRRATPAPEQLASNLLQFGCPVVLMPEPRQGAGTEQLAISSDSDDSTTPQQGQNGSNQGQSHAKSQGQPNGLDLPKVHVSGPSDNPDILSSDHGSAGSLGARSAPSTPLQGNIGTNPLSLTPLVTTPSSTSVGSSSLQTPKSPTHGSLKCNESTISKPLSKSTPSMAAVNSTTIAVIKTSQKSSPMSTSSSGRQKKFHRHFTQVAPDECVLNYYSCALVGDILLQGHLYITPNYFAFYSNVFGYVTKLLIPATSVLKISKEKTAKIIPNAVAIATIDERHVFCSLLSRDSTYKLMKQVWDAAMEPKLAEEILPCPVETKLLVPQALLVDDSEVNPEEDDSSMSESGVDLERSPVVRSDLTTCADDTEVESVASTNIPRPSLTVTRMESPSMTSKCTKRNTAMGSLRCFTSNGLSASTVITILVAILAALYVSAALMMIRIDRLHTAYLNHPLASPDRFTQERLLNYLNTNLDQIVKIRQSLQTLSQQFVLINQADGRDGTTMDPEDAPS